MVVHSVVKPFEYGSYENTGLLDLLSKKFRVDYKDRHGRTPIDYAQNQKSSVMLRKLKALGSAPADPSFLEAAHPSLWEDDEVNFEADAQANVESQMPVSDEAVLVSLDSQAHQIKNVRLFVTPGKEVYNVLLTKTEINYNRWSMNVFYKMQILLETVREVYIVYTRWGRIGSSGQNQ